MLIKLIVKLIKVLIALNKFGLLDDVIAALEGLTAEETDAETTTNA